MEIDGLPCGFPVPLVSNTRYQQFGGQFRAPTGGMHTFTVTFKHIAGTANALQMLLDDVSVTALFCAEESVPASSSVSSAASALTVSLAASSTLSVFSFTSSSTLSPSSSSLPSPSPPACPNLLVNPTFNTGSLSPWSSSGVLGEQMGYGHDDSSYWFRNFNRDASGISITQTGVAITSGSMVDCSAWLATINAAIPSPDYLAELSIFIDGILCGAPVSIGQSRSAVYQQAGGSTVVQGDMHTIMLLLQTKGARDYFTLLVDDVRVALQDCSSPSPALSSSVSLSSSSTLASTSALISPSPSPSPSVAPGCTVGPNLLTNPSFNTGSFAPWRADRGSVILAPYGGHNDASSWTFDAPTQIELISASQDNVFIPSGSVVDCYAWFKQTVVSPTPDGFLPSAGYTIAIDDVFCGSPANVPGSTADWTQFGGQLTVEGNMHTITIVVSTTDVDPVMGLSVQVDDVAAAVVNC
ncbi:hypothetical protein NX059_000329 [Plenodomus lindquistii]|nr:hypothetical protein NX059_000329 [Plenodomus lindquistii]